jgi:hypothetical protein
VILLGKNDKLQDPQDVGTNVEQSADDEWTVVQGKTKRKRATELNAKKTQVKGKRLENSGCEQKLTLK